MSLDKNIRFYEKSFVPKKLTAFLSLGFEMISGLFFEKMGVVLSDCIPKFRSSLMDIVESRQIEVLFMPTKKSLPSSNITIRLSNSLNFLSQGVSEERVETVEVPLSCILIHESSGKVSSIDRRRICDCLPELN